mmetsp:Transcript_7017/g.17984  ORF Transcript_7017/g.17984 Transcript_7017/m.17984 type:complete len:387 (+) Transcript_7017:1392-2552(+)
MFIAAVPSLPASLLFSLHVLIATSRFSPDVVNRPRRTSPNAPLPTISRVSTWSRGTSQGTTWRCIGKPLATSRSIFSLKSWGAAFLSCTARRSWASSDVILSCVLRVRYISRRFRSSRLNPANAIVAMTAYVATSTTTWPVSCHPRRTSSTPSVTRQHRSNSESAAVVVRGKTKNTSSVSNRDASSKTIASRGVRYNVEALCSGPISTSVMPSPSTANKRIATDHSSPGCNVSVHSVSRHDTTDKIVLMIVCTECIDKTITSTKRWLHSVTPSTTYAAMPYKTEKSVIANGIRWYSRSHFQFLKSRSASASANRGNRAGPTSAVTAISSKSDAMTMRKLLWSPLPEAGRPPRTVGESVGLFILVGDASILLTLSAPCWSKISDTRR